MPVKRHFNQYIIIIIIIIIIIAAAEIIQIEEDAEDEDKSSETYEADQSVFEDHGNKQVSPSDSVTATGRRKQHSRKVTATGHHKREATRQVGHRNWSSQAASGSRNI